MARPEVREGSTVILRAHGLLQEVREGLRQGRLIPHRLNAEGGRLKWGAEEQRAFGALKGRPSVCPHLGYPDMQEKFILDTDASKCAIGLCSPGAGREGGGNRLRESTSDQE